MLWSQLFLPTIKEIPSEAESPSHQLMLRAGLIRKLASGIYSYLPLGVRVLEKISAIIREELNRIGCQEVLLPVIHPAELWQKTGRWDKVDVLFKLKDRSGRDFLLGPTHEEVITTLVAQEIKSYRQLPVSLYQIQTKFRDEARPRSGVIRSREFIMMDLYSFHRTQEDLQKTYWQVYEAYRRIYQRCGFQIRIIEGETGDIGGDVSHQFELITEAGEDTTLLCPKCSYGADLWTAAFKSVEPPVPAPAGAPQEKIATPGAKTVDSLVQLLGKSPKDFIKTMVVEADGKLCVVCIRGDREINELRVKKYLKAKKFALATPEKAKGLALGFVGPVGLNGIEVLADFEVKGMSDAICGANEKDYHFQHVTYGRDFKSEKFADFRLAAPGDLCPRCAAPMEEKHGIELGQTFILGTIYSEPLGCTYLEDDGTGKPMIMGCYGIGVSRMTAALIEQHHDANGIQWPVSAAPYDVVVVPVNTNDSTQFSLATALYSQCKKEGLDTVLDDRDVRGGVKFKDADLIGFPYRITVGQKAAEGKVELYVRKENRMEDLPAAEAVSRLLSLRKKAFEELLPLENAVAP